MRRRKVKDELAHMQDVPGTPGTPGTVPSARERVLQWEDPTPTIDFVRRSAGIDAIRAISAGELPRPPISVLTNFTIVEVAEGRVVVEGYPGEEHYNPIGTVHGGFALTIFDTAMSCAVHTLLPAGVGYTTTDVQVRFVRAVTVATGTVRCEGIALHVGRSTAIAEGKLYDSAGKLLGVGSTGCAVLRTLRTTEPPEAGSETARR